MKITKNEHGLYNLKSTISDEQLHDEIWITEFEAKKVLIEKLYCDFVNNAIQISMDFPNGYMVNGKYIRGEREYFNYFQNCIENDFINMFTDFNNIVDELKLDVPKIENN